MKNKFWPKPCYEFSIEDCINSGFLSNYKIFGSGFSFNTSKYKNLTRELNSSEIKNIVSTAKYEHQVKEFVEICKIEKRTKVAVICSNIEHAENVYNEILKYEPAHLIHSKIKNSNEISELYKKDDVKFSVSVLQLSEGYDNEYIDGIVLLRPTRSTRLAIQIFGRGLRLSKDKDYCLILDYAEVAINVGTPHNPIIPAPKKPGAPASLSPIRQCEECFFIFERESGSTCPNCGHENKVVRDVEKNLKKSLLDSDVHYMTVGKENIHKFGVSKNGKQFMTLKVEGSFHTLFMFQRKAVLSAMKHTGKCKITYSKEGKFRFKFIKAESA